MSEGRERKRRGGRGRGIRREGYMYNRHRGGRKGYIHAREGGEEGERERKGEEGEREGEGEGGREGGREGERVRD